MIINIDGFEYTITDGSIIMDADPRLMFEDRGNINSDNDVADAHDRGHIIVSKNWVRSSPVKMMLCVCGKGLLYPHGSYDGNKIRCCDACLSQYQLDNITKGWVRIAEAKRFGGIMKDFEARAEFVDKIGDAADKFRMKNTGCKAIDKRRLTNWSNPPKEVKTTFLRKMRCEDGFVRMLEFEHVHAGKVHVIRLHKEICSDMILGEDICIIEKGFGLYKGWVLRLQKYSGTEVAEMVRHPITNIADQLEEENIKKNIKVIEHREPNRKNSRKSHPKKRDSNINFLTIEPKIESKIEGFVVPRSDIDKLLPNMKPKQQIEYINKKFGVKLEFYPGDDNPLDDIFGCTYEDEKEIKKLDDELVIKRIWNRGSNEEMA